MALYFLSPETISLLGAVLRYVGIMGLSELAQICDTVLLEDLLEVPQL